MALKRQKNKVHLFQSFVNELKEESECRTTETFCRDLRGWQREEQDLQAESELSDTQTVGGTSGCILPRKRGKKEIKNKLLK